MGNSQKAEGVWFQKDGGLCSRFISADLDRDEIVTACPPVRTQPAAFSFSLLPRCHPSSFFSFKKCVYLRFLTLIRGGREGVKEKKDVLLKNVV